MVAFFYIATSMKAVKQFFQIIFFFLLVGCVSDNNENKNNVKELENTIQQKKPAGKNKAKISDTKETLAKTSDTKETLAKNNNSNVSNSKKNKKAVLNNTKLPVDERTTALRKFEKSISKPDEYNLLKKIVQNPKEHLRLREGALKKIYQKSGEDLDMLQYMFSVIRSNDDSFKPAVLYALKTISYSSQLLQQKKSAYLQAMRDGLLTTQGIEAYRQLIKDLAAANDTEAAKTLINNLKTNDFSKFKPKDIFEILNRNQRPEFYSSLHTILQNTKNAEVKTGILPLIVEYPPGRTTLLQLLDNTKEDIKVRLKAAEVIADKSKPQFYQYTRAIIFDENDNIKLRRYCLRQLEKFDFKVVAKYNRLQKDLESFASTDAKLIKSAGNILARF